MGGWGGWCSADGVGELQEGSIRGLSTDGVYASEVLDGESVDVVADVLLVAILAGGGQV